MANPMKGESVVRLADGRTLTLAFNVSAWIAAERVLREAGAPMTAAQIVSELQTGNASMEVQRAVIFGGLRKNHPDIDLEESGEIMLEAAEAMAEGLASGMPPAGETDGDAAEAGPPKPRHRTGTKR